MIRRLQWGILTMLVESRLPKAVSHRHLYPEGYCYHVYMPFCSDGKTFHLPESLEWVEPILNDIEVGDMENFKYAYLTVKHMYVDGYQNRPGWHIDGFGSDDINYIWCNTNPTQVAVQDFMLSRDHEQSLKQMEELGPADGYDPGCDGWVETLSCNILYRLDTSVVHRCAPVRMPTLRTFVKISLSNDIYNLEGNATNPLLSLGSAKKVRRSVDRNHPVGGV